MCFQPGAINGFASAENRLRQHNADYDHNVTVAATTPNYAWVPIVGWVAGGNVDKTREVVGEALEVIQGIQGAWFNLASQLDGLQSKIERRIRDGKPIILKRNIDNVIRDWKDVGKKAYTFAVNAFITVERKAA